MGRLAAELLIILTPILAIDFLRDLAMYCCKLLLVLDWTRGKVVVLAWSAIVAGKSY